MTQVLEEFETLPAASLEPVGGIENWRKDSGYSCEVRVRKGEDAKYVAYVPTLAGVYGQGDDMESVKADVAAALSAAIEAYVAEGRKIPWRDAELDDPLDLSFRVMINA